MMPLSCHVFLSLAANIFRVRNIAFWKIVFYFKKYDLEMVRFVQRDICLIKKKVRNNQNAYMLYAIHALSYLHMQAGIVDAILARRVGGVVCARGRLPAIYRYLI